LPTELKSRHRSSAEHEGGVPEEEEEEEEREDKGVEREEM
jgi:hypothetical protein